MENSLVPVKIDRQWKVMPAASDAAPFYWRVTLGKKHTGGKKQRRFFKTYEAAASFIESAAGARIMQGQEAFSIPQRLRIEAMECSRRLAPVGVSLTQAVDYFLKHAIPKGGRRTFDMVAREFMEARKAMNCRHSTLTMYRSFLKILGAEFGSKQINEISTDSIEKWLVGYQPKAAEEDPGRSKQGLNPRTRKNYLVTLRTVFDFAKARDYCSENPAARISNPIQEDKPAGILTPAQAIAILRAAVKRDAGIVPGIAIALFAGLRRSEICALDWSEIDLGAGTIEVKGSKAKTRQRRVVSIQPNLAEWLRPHAKKNGRIAPCPDVFGERLRELIRNGGKREKKGEAPKPLVEEWPQNALRHSFGSYFFGKTNDENLTAAQMGNSPYVVHAHYKALVREPGITAYWDIRPSRTRKQRPPTINQAALRNEPRSCAINK
jgi:integrase